MLKTIEIDRPLQAAILHACTETLVGILSLEIQTAERRLALATIIHQEIDHLPDGFVADCVDQFLLLAGRLQQPNLLQGFKVRRER